jgi:hypothetical protein
MKLKVFGTAFLVLALTACSTRPQEPAAPAASAPVTAAKPAPTAGAVATPTAMTGTPNANGSKPVLSRALAAAGYKATVIKGETYYCRKEDITNTAFKKTVCLNEAQLREQERRTKEMQDRMMSTQNNGACHGPECG